MKILEQGLCLTLLGAALAATPGLQTSAAAQAAAPDRSLVQEMRATADGSVRVTKETATGSVGFIGARGAERDLLPGLAGDSTARAVAKADAYLDRFGAAFGVEQGALVEQGVSTDEHGRTVTFTQKYRGVDVFGSMIRAHLDEEGNLTSVNGYAAPDLSLDVEPRLPAKEAGARAVASVHADPARTESGRRAGTTGIVAEEPRLVVYRTGAIKGEPGEAVLAYQVEVTNRRNVRDMLFVDADSGKVVNRWSMVANALDRRLWDWPNWIDPAGIPTWTEGSSTDTLTDEERGLVDVTGETYWLFRNAFGRDSFNAAGARMHVVTDPPAEFGCPNASWNGFNTTFCPGITSDDTVAHEWAHAYMEYTADLIYQYQSGALNESFSDVWGQTVDMLNTEDNETPDTARTVDECSAFSSVLPNVEITAPASIASSCLAGGSTWGDPPTTVGFESDVVAAIDAAEPADGDPAGTTTDGCSPYLNTAQVANKIAMVDRGRCSFVEKARRARGAGVAALVIGNNDDAPLSFAAEDHSAPLPYTVGLGRSDREKIRAALATGETVRMRISAKPIEREESYRWLIGEADDGFGGAIRDMWNPTCYRDPGKVTDAEYACDPNLEDGGGIHHNSGVPNHAFALLVDGGSYNGHTVSAIGLDKATAIWWRTQSEYLTPVSDFVDMANGLEASCADLVGDSVTHLTAETLTEAGTPTPGETVIQADCAAVAAAIAAVELRQEPVKCNFRSLLDQDTPPTCGPGFTRRVVWKEEFEDGLAGWTKRQDVVKGGIGAPWVSTEEAPGDHEGGVAYGPADDRVGCSSSGDFSSSASIIGPQVRLPAGATRPRLTFDHYVATEAGYDGGNVKYRLNGGAFRTIPAAAYVFNQPFQLASAPDNSNPLAGQPAFTGADGGKLTGSWGQSQVDLSKLGAGPRDRIRLRLDIGRDSCAGLDGWYVDNVTVSHCRPVPAATRLPAARTRSRSGS